LTAGEVNEKSELRLLMLMMTMEEKENYFR
jgi:hypothetical protein